MRSLVFPTAFAIGWGRRLAANRRAAGLRDAPMKIGSLNAKAENRLQPGSLTVNRKEKLGFDGPSQVWHHEAVNLRCEVQVLDRPALILRKVMSFYDNR